LLFTMAARSDGGMTLPSDTAMERTSLLQTDTMSTGNGKALTQ
jgi:hypothetical protein